MTNQHIVERVLLATIRDKGLFPCPRCLLPKTSFYRVGLCADISARAATVRQYLVDKISAARDAIYKLGAPIRGAVPERHLKGYSLVPTFVRLFSPTFCHSFTSHLQNAFAVRLGFLDFNLFPMLVVDLLHEFELGVFKSVFKHLIRLLNAINSDAIINLNGR